MYSLNYPKDLTKYMVTYTIMKIHGLAYKKQHKHMLCLNIFATYLCIWSHTHLSSILTKSPPVHTTMRRDKKEKYDICF